MNASKLIESYLVGSRVPMNEDLLSKLHDVYSKLRSCVDVLKAVEGASTGEVSPLIAKAKSSAIASMSALNDASKLMLKVK